MNWYHPDMDGRRIYPSMVRPIKPAIRRVYSDGKVLLACTEAQRKLDDFMQAELIEVVW